MVITLEELRDQFIGLCIEVYGMEGKALADNAVIAAGVDDWIAVGNTTGTVYPLLDYLEGFFSQRDYPWCSECGHPSDVRVVDNGVGKTEFQGVVSNDIQTVLETTCCEGVPYDDALLTLETEMEDQCSH